MERFDFAFMPCRGPARGECARQGRQAVAITNAGGYVALREEPYLCAFAS